MNPRDYFPLGKAKGKAFCNRKEETEWLLDNIKANKHTLLIAPRRFGKSSLAERAVEKINFPSINLNFNACVDENDVEMLIRQSVSQLIGKIFGPIEKLTNSIKNYVNHLIPKIIIGAKYTKLELNSSKHISVTANVEEALLLLEKLLAEKKQRAIMIFDEFQAIGQIAKGKGIEAAIRNAAQDMKNLEIIFSGSNRNLLISMFEDESRPLYKLCRKLYLKRIKPEHYRKHLNKAAKLAWKSELDSNAFEKIMSFSECHPYYVNYLCDVIWTENSILPKTVNVIHAWNTVIEEEKSDANAELSSLSMGQKKVLKHIANSSGENLMSTHSTQAMNMALSSISSAIAKLTEKDIIEKEGDSYYIINPIIASLLKE